MTRQILLMLQIESGLAFASNTSSTLYFTYAFHVWDDDAFLTFSCVVPCQLMAFPP